MSQRSDRVGDLLRAEIAAIIQHEMRDPRVRLTTVSSITVSRDLSHADVRVSVLGEDAHREESLEALGRAAGFIRSTLAKAESKATCLSQRSQWKSSDPSPK